MAGASFKVQGELVISSDLAGANAAKASLEGLSAAGRKLVETNAAVAVATGQAAQAQSAATNAAKSQADGFARLAQQQAADAAKARTQAMMAAVEQSGPQLQAMYGAATRAQQAELAKGASASKVYEEAQARVRVANDNTAGSIERQNKALTQQRVQLGYQLNDVFVQLASGQGVVRTAVQQGPQITQLFGGIGNTLRAIPLAAAGYATAIAAVVGITAAAILQVNEFSARNRQSEISLQATGRAAQVTASQLELVVEAEARRPGADRSETQKAALQLLANNQITGESVQRTLALARDLARITGTDLPTAAAALSSGLDGTVAGARRLDATFNALTPAELEQIRRYEEMGQRGAAVGVVLKALERQLAGANEKGVTPLEKGTAALRASWNTLLDSFGKTGVLQLAAGALNQMALPLTMIATAVDVLNSVRGGSGAAATGPNPDDVRRAQESLRFARQQLAEAEANQKQNPGDYQFENAVNVARRRVADLQANVAQLEGQAATVTAKAVQDQVQGEATALKNEVKDALAVLDKSVTVAAQRRALESERAQIEKATKSGLLDPDQLGRAQERITQIDGQLKGLRTPAEELQRGLDLEGTLARLPAHLQAAERAYLETKRRVLEQGGTLDAANKAADQARANVLQTQATATSQQIQLLSAEAQAALSVADAYGTSRARALQLQAQLKAQAAEQQGSIAPGTAGEFARRSLEEQAASTIATSAEKNEAYAREVAGLERLVVAEARSSAAAREAERANKVATYAEDLRAQAAATNNAVIIAAAERQIATYDALTRRASLADVRREAGQLNRQYDPAVAYDQETEKLRELQATGLLTRRTIEEYTKESELRRLEASRDATDGMIAGLKRYADEATNAGQAAAAGVTSGLRTIEDTLVQVATTGQITFSNLANSIIADIARIAIRQNITGPIAQGLGGINWGGIFGSIFGGAGASAPKYNVGGDIIPGTYHTGGLVGRDGTPRGGLPIALWANAPRYHGGGLVRGERAIIAMDDEEVLTTDNPRHRWNVGRAGRGAGGTGGGYGGGYGGNIEVNVHNYGDNKVSTRKTDLGDGSSRLDILVEKLEGMMGDNILRQRGSVYGAVQTSFGLSPRGRA